MRKVKLDEPMKAGTRLYVSVSIAESKVSKRFDTIPSATLHPNADEINYLRRLVFHKDIDVWTNDVKNQVPYTHFVVWTDNVATSCWETMKKLTPKQARWQDYLAEFNYELRYKPGKANQISVQLSAYFCAIICMELLST